MSRESCLIANWVISFLVLVTVVPFSSFVSDMSPSAQGLTLHIWPSTWDLPSIEPSCIVAAFYLQLALPGRFSIQECTNPDASPSGRSVSAEIVPPCALKLFFWFTRPATVSNSWPPLCRAFVFHREICCSSRPRVRTTSHGG